MSNTKKSAGSTRGRKSNLLTDEERAAMKATVEERRRERSGEADGESDVLAKIAEMSGSDRVMARRLHAIIKASAPNLSPKTWYGMPAYAKDGKLICSSKPRKSSRRDTRPLALSRRQTSTRVTCGRHPLL